MRGIRKIIALGFALALSGVASAQVPNSGYGVPNAVPGGGSGDVTAIGTLTAGDIIAGGGGTSIQDASALTSVNAPVGIHSTQAITQATSMSTAVSVLNFQNTLAGACNDGTRCYVNLFQITENPQLTNNSSRGRYHNWWNSTIQGNGSDMGQGGIFFNDMDGTVGGTLTAAGAINVTTFSVHVTGQASFGGGAGTEKGAVFASNFGVTLGASTSHINGGTVLENDFLANASATYLDAIFILNAPGSGHTAGTRQNVSLMTSRAGSPGTTAGVDTLIQDGGYNGYPGISTAGQWGRCWTHATSDGRATAFSVSGTGNCGTIGSGFDFYDYYAISNYIVRGPQGNGYIDGAFNISATAYSVGATAGVDCTGVTAGTVVVTKGIITHC